MTEKELLLTHEGAESLRELAQALPIATENIESETQRLMAIYQSLSENLGVHKIDFEKMFFRIRRMQTEATYAINALVPKMNAVADKIDSYVGYNVASTVTSDTSTKKASYTSIHRSTSSSNIDSHGYTKEDVAIHLGIYPFQLTEAFSKYQNDPSQADHELSSSIRHPDTGEVLKPVKGYYIKNECVYAEYTDKQGRLYSYCKQGNTSVLSQMKKDGVLLQSDIKDDHTKDPLIQQIRCRKRIDPKKYKISPSFTSSPPWIQKQMALHKDAVSVKGTSHDSCYYPRKRTIYIHAYDDDTYSDVYKHEYGHVVDHMNGWLSETPLFIEALKRDCANLDITNFDGSRRTTAMLMDLKKRNARFDRGISDILSGIYRNDPLIVNSYQSEGLARYYHDNEYWEIDKNLEKEVFAQFFAIYSKDNADSRLFVQTYFPNTDKAFKELLENL